MACKYNVIHLLLLLILLAGCADRQPKQTTVGTGTPMPLSYARQFTISHSENYTTLTVLNPWKAGEVYETYYLVKNDRDSVPPDGRKVLIPLKNIMVNSTTHIGFLKLLDELDKITGVCSGGFIYDPYISESLKTGRIQDLGDSFNLDIERLLMLRPQAIITTAYNADDENSKRMRQSGLTILYNVEWQEESLLGRAEWIKFFGALFDKQAMADSLFSSVAQRYNEAKEQVAEETNKPSVLSGQDFRGSWSMPGGKSFNARLFQDAGADYYYKADSTSGSISTTIEEALVHFSKADVWLGAQATTLEELGRTDSKYKLFKAFRDGNVYNTNKRVNNIGGNDYWEMAVARPDLLLYDMIKIFHPHVLPEYELTYLQKLE